MHMEDGNCISITTYYLGIMLSYLTPLGPKDPSSKVLLPSTIAATYMVYDQQPSQSANHNVLVLTPVQALW